MASRSRHLLLVTYHFPPSAASGSFRLLGFSKYLPALGWKVTVVAPPSMPGEPVDPGLAAQVPSGVEVRAVAYPTRGGKPVRVFFPYAAWLAPAWPAVRDAARNGRPDVVLTSGPPHLVHLLGLWIARRHRTPWIADFRDPWVNDGLGRPRRWIDRWFQVCERSVYRNADRILANAPNAMDVYRRDYPRQQHKIRMLTNGFDPHLVMASPAPALAPGSPLRLVHAGEIYLGRDPLPLLDAMREIQQATPVGGPRLELHILGRAERGRAQMEAAIRERGLTDSVVFRGQVSYQESLAAMAEADINVLFDTPNRKFGVPAKLYEYLGAGRPVLALAESDGDTANILREAGLRHAIAHPLRTGEIRDALSGLIAARGEGSPVIADPARLARFTRENLAGTLAGIMDEVLAEREASRVQ
ncbi:MAG: glycosyltransferase family 4 protein [Candidatus Krumholzibacteria bacterium]|nr:glycosyltransferase family 4 protein [Candidatus Krumholzibacteria bacterium]MDH4336470.1 glycosyltransferase family 4 protein [Candidatus Krumholzibacteria bacterium]MDH5269062.1 glycosyltransferase family 4 protein [Candidatus Krumholzibacteria bacterium]